MSSNLLTDTIFKSINKYYVFGERACSRHNNVSWAMRNEAIAPQCNEERVAQSNIPTIGGSVCGMEWNNKWELSDTISPLNRYRYNAKEYVPEMGLNQLLYGARNFDPVLGRWWVVDPLTSEYPSKNPYYYVHNNPIMPSHPIDIFVYSTRIYNSGGKYRCTFDDNPPKKEYFYSLNSSNVRTL